MVVNEYLINSSRIKPQSETKAREILEETRHTSIWEEVSANLLRRNAKDNLLLCGVKRLGIESPFEQSESEEDFSPQRYKYSKIEKNMGVNMPGFEGKENKKSVLASSKLELNALNSLEPLTNMANTSYSTMPTTPLSTQTSKGSTWNSNLSSMPKGSWGMANTSYSTTPTTPLSTRTSKNMSRSVPKFGGSCSSLNPYNKHLGILLSPAKFSIKRICNRQDSSVIGGYHPSSGIEVILNYRNKGKAEPNILDLAVRKECVSRFQDDFNEAIELCESRQYDEACEVYQKIINAMKALVGSIDFELACYNKAVVLYAQGKYDSASKVFQELANNHDCEWASVAQHNVAVVFCKQEKYDDALKILKEMKKSKHNISSVECDRDIKRIEEWVKLHRSSIPASDFPNTTENISTFDRPSTIMSGVESEEHATNSMDLG